MTIYWIICTVDNLEIVCQMENISVYLISLSIVVSDKVASWLWFYSLCIWMTIILAGANIGCYMNGVPFNHVGHADDSLIMAPSPVAFQRLQELCNRKLW